MNATHYRESFHVSGDHPALPGHFPDRPVVPGVVLLDRVAAAIERWCGAHIVGLPQVKFFSPLAPGQIVELDLTADGERIRFTIAAAGAPIANGIADVAQA